MSTSHMLHRLDQKARTSTITQKSMLHMRSRLFPAPHITGPCCTCSGGYHQHHTSHIHAAHSLKAITSITPHTGMLHTHTLFMVWERSASHLTVRPVGMCLTRTADSVLFTCCPPAPPDLIVVISRSLSGTSIVLTCSPACKCHVMTP